MGGRRLTRLRLPFCSQFITGGRFPPEPIPVTGDRQTARRRGQAESGHRNVATLKPVIINGGGLCGIACRHCCWHGLRAFQPSMMRVFRLATCAQEPARLVYRRYQNTVRARRRAGASLAGDTFQIDVQPKTLPHQAHWYLQKPGLQFRGMESYVILTIFDLMKRREPVSHRTIPLWCAGMYSGISTFLNLNRGCPGFTNTQFIKLQSVAGGFCMVACKGQFHLPEAPPWHSQGTVDTFPSNKLCPGRYFSGVESSSFRLQSLGFPDYGRLTLLRLTPVPDIRGRTSL